jgi:hypothetical protein
MTATEKKVRSVEDLLDLVTELESSPSCSGPGWTVGILAVREGERVFRLDAYCDVPAPFIAPEDGFVVLLGEPSSIGPLSFGTTLLAALRDAEAKIRRGDIGLLRGPSRPIGDERYAIVRELVRPFRLTDRQLEAVCVAWEEDARGVVRVFNDALRGKRPAPLFVAKIRSGQYWGRSR